MGRKRKIDNPNNPATKIVKEDGEKQNQKALNPLFMTEILPKIFNYLDIDNLKRSRLVCKLWGFEGGRILLNKSNIKIDSFAKTREEEEENSEESEQLENFLSTLGISAKFNSAIKYMQDPDRLKNILPLLLQRTSALSLNPFFPPKGNTALVEFLEFFPNLQILHLGNDWEIPEDASAEIKKSLLDKFESLKEIRLTVYSSYNLRNLLLTKSELAVKEIHLRDSSPLLFFEKYLESECNWPIDSLLFTTNSISPELLNTIPAFLEKISGSLKDLEWSFTGPQHLDEECLVPWANILIIPSALNRLKTLEIFSKSRNSTSCDFLWLLLAFALQLPNLKKLTMNEVPENLEERIRKWNEHPKALGRTLKSESLEELKIIRYWDEMPVENLIIFSRRLWPSLKSLWIENSPNNFPTSGFLLSDWSGLEGLDLKFGSMDKSEVNLWTSWFTGGEKSEDGNSSQGDANFSLKDLKDLKHFGLWEIRDEKRSGIACDFLVENRLKFMTQLQSLYFENSKMSPEVKEMLKETLGPNVHFEFE